MLLTLLLGGAAAVADDYPFSGRLQIESPREVFAQAGNAIHLSDRIRICTYNAENFFDGVKDGAHRTPAVARRHARQVAALVEEIDPDILLLQEVENDAALKLLNESLGQPYPIGYVTDFAPRDEQVEKLNLAVLSRLPLYGLREFDFASLEGPGRPPRGALSFCVDLGGHHRLLVYVVHLKSNYGEAARNRALRRHAMAILRRDADAVRAKYPGAVWEVVVAGDMNTDPQAPGFERDPTLEPFADWTDLWRARAPTERVTVPSREDDAGQSFPPAAFDRFIVSEDLSRTPWVAGLPHALMKGVDVRDVASRGGRSLFHVSDHYPVYLDLLRDL